MEEKKKCENCALFSRQQIACVRTQTRVHPVDSCSYWTNTVMQCESCGRSFVPPATIYYDGADTETAQMLVICGDCFANRGNCLTCSNGGKCDFKENTEITEPQMVQQIIHQGNIVMAKMVLNLARVELTCKKCHCFHVESGCCARGNFGTCGNYDFRKGAKV